MLKNDYLVVKIGVDTAENEPFESGMIPKISVVFFSILRAGVRIQAVCPPLRVSSCPSRRASFNATRVGKSCHFQTVRSRLYQRRFLQPNNHFAAFFKIYKICTLLHRSELKFLKKIVQLFQKSVIKICFFLKFCIIF